MTISAMKQALEALEEVQRYDKTSEWFEKKVSALRQAIEQAEKQEPVAQAWDEGYRTGINDERMSEANIGIAGFGAKVEPARNNPYRTTPPAQAPVHAIDISQERVDETAKDKHEGVEQPDLAKVGEVGVWGHQREWVGLTDEEIEAIYEQEGHADVVLLTQAKLKEKNVPQP